MATAMEMDTTIINQPMISQAMAMVMVMVMEMETVTTTTLQTINTYLHSPMYLNHNHNHRDQTTNTFHHHQTEIVQTVMATATSTHNPDIDTKAVHEIANPFSPITMIYHPLNQLIKTDQIMTQLFLQAMFNP